MFLIKKKVENHEYPVIIRQWFSSDRYPAGYYPILSGIRENGIRHIPTLFILDISVSSKLFFP